VTEDSFLALPAFPLEQVVDPTGAGDTFAGGFVGYLSRHPARSDEVLRRATAHGSALASFNVEAFGTERMPAVSIDDVHARVRDLQRFTRFDPAVLEIA
jgi:sugar/nucleoside kinase (ribokinase family)